MQQRHEVPQNFRRALTSRLRTLVQQDKLEKVIFVSQPLKSWYLGSSNLLKNKQYGSRILIDLPLKTGGFISSNSQLQVQNCYKIKNGAVLETRPPPPRQKDVQQPRQIQSIGHLGDTVEEAAAYAAYKIAEAENKSFVAAESVKEAERVARMAEDMESLLQFAMDCFDQSTLSKP